MIRRLALLGIVAALMSAPLSADAQERFPGFRRFWKQWVDPLDLFEKPAAYRLRGEPLPAPVPGLPSEKTLVSAPTVQP